MSEAPTIDVHSNLRLLGTAHIATASVEAVRQQIAEYQPDIVAVELCKSRYDALVSDRRLDKEGLLKVIKEGKAPMVLMQSMLSAEQRKLGINWENTMQGKCKRGAFTWGLIAEDWCFLDNGGPRVAPKSKRTKQSVEEE